MHNLDKGADRSSSTFSFLEVQLYCMALFHSNHIRRTTKCQMGAAIPLNSEPKYYDISEAKQNILASSVMFVSAPIIHDPFPICGQWHRISGWVRRWDGAQKPQWAHAQCCMAASASPPFVNDRGQERVIAFSCHARPGPWLVHLWGDISLCSCLTVLPGQAWILHSKISMLLAPSPVVKFKFSRPS